MATLVTGGTGFVASNIVRTLLEKGEEVVSFDLVPPHPLFETYTRPWKGRLTAVQGDLLDQEDLAKLADRGITRIVHAAVFTGVLPHIERDRSRSIVDINVMGATNMLELARRLDVSRFLYVSSGSVYGDDYPPGTVLTEDTVPRPRTLYAVTKYTSEMLTRRYSGLHGFPAVSTRLGTPYGPMERVTGHRENQSVMKEWTRAVLRGEPIHIADPSVTRAFSYVKDIAAGICAVLDAPRLSHEVYNVTTGEPRTLGQMLDALREAEPNVRVVESADAAAPRGGNTMSGERLKRDLGFTGRYDLPSGLREYLAWRRENNFVE